MSAIRDDGPVVVMEHKFLGFAAKGHVPEETYTLPIGKAEIVREGTHVTLCGIGRMTHICLEAAEQLAEQGVQAEVVDVLTLAPLDEETICESVRRTHRLVVVDEDTPVASMARDIAARVGEQAFDWLEAPGEDRHRSRHARPLCRRSGGRVHPERRQGRRRRPGSDRVMADGPRDRDAELRDVHGGGNARSVAQAVGR